MSLAEFVPEGSSPSLVRDRRPGSARRGKEVDVLRPVQYLGNKQRSLGMIVSAIEGLVGSGDAVADLFSGTSVVSQALSALDLRVTAVDVSPACGAMAQATLGVGRFSSSLSGSELLNMWQQSSEPVYDSLGSVFAPWIDRERSALEARDGSALIEIGRSVPQVWRPAGKPGAIDGLFAAWEEATLGGQATAGLLSPVIAGSYLGIAQAVILDARRQAIAEMSARGEIDRWQVSVMVTALLAAASAAVFSPGKHFAQPHRTDESKDLDFHSGRIVSDRSVDVAAKVAEVVELLTASRCPQQAHEVLQVPVDEISAAELVAREVRLVYADPPYTAQQYSRFYHVLDTLAEGRPRPLQIHRGGVTSGLYPDHRYLSPFCSKRQAPTAFSQLATACRAASATLVLSYSTSASGSTGNARMITLDDLCRVLVSAYGPGAVEVTELTHGYRQFNHRDSARSGRDDPEVLVIAHAA